MTYSWEEKNRTIREHTDQYVDRFMASSPLAHTARQEGWETRLRHIAEMKAGIQAQVMNGSTAVGTFVPWFELPIDDPLLKAKSYIAWLIKEAQNQQGMGIGFSEKEVAHMRKGAGGYRAKEPEPEKPKETPAYLLEGASDEFLREFGPQ